jgi:hypothetical protein
MKINKITLPFKLLLLITLASCTQSFAGATPSSLIETVPAVNTKLPKPILTETPAALPTSTVVPTLTVDDAHERLLELLKGNYSCILPCLWNITPGESKYSDAQVILSSLSSISGLPPVFQDNGGVVFPFYTDGDWVLNTNISFVSANQVVKHITFQSQILKRVIASNGESGFSSVFDTSPLSKYIEQYMLPSVLSQLGIPTSVVISTLANPPSPTANGGFDIVVIYPERGVLAHYKTQRQLVDGIIQGCFTDSPVEVELFPVGNRGIFSEELASTSWAGFWPGPVVSPYWKPLEQATNLSLEEFYETFSEITEECVETPATIWP